VTNDLLDKRAEINLVVEWMILNGCALFLMVGGLSGVVSDALTISEAQWQAGVPRRKFLLDALYYAQPRTKLPEGDPRLVIAANVIRYVCFPVIILWIGYKFFGLNPAEFIRGILYVGGPNH
jgi:hypothetical protein